MVHAVVNSFLLPWEQRTVHKLLKKMTARKARGREAAEAELLRLGLGGVEPLLGMLGKGPPQGASAARVLLQICSTKVEDG